ncbi:GNAT family N-acetyltransferase [Kribbella sp. NBC_01510]|uniref:GNAT family N-acetyltransferase n=1 Tax=Kribbella sp. NBC_01510 TaxID=2903581 RepID=UPI003870E90A
MPEIAVLTSVEPARLPDLLHLFATAWWMSDRTLDETVRILAESDLVLTLQDQDTDRLVGFARILTDYAHVALVLDVVVAAEHRGAGLGAALMDAVVSHPRLADVRSIELVCQPELVPFYRRWGFTDEVGRSLLMRRTADARLG